MSIVTVPHRISSHVSDTFARPVPSRLREDLLRESNTDSTPLAGLSAAVLGLTLRGSLIDSDREYLDRVGGANAIVFLIHGSRWVHPADLPLFDYELIETAVTICGEAVVSHRYQPRENDPETWYTVMTAVLNPGDEVPLVLGILSPENRREAAARQGQFSDVVSAFRACRFEFGRACDIIRAAGNSDEPLIVVDQTTGTVLHANSPACQLAEWTDSSIIGASFDDISGLLPLCSSGPRLMIRQIPVAGLALSLVGVPSSPGGTDSAAIQATGPLADELHSALDDLTVSVSELKSYVAAAGNTVAASLLDRIDSQAILVRDGIEHLTRLVLRTPATAEDDLP